MSSNIFLNQTIFPFSPTSTNAPSISSSSNKRMKGITVSRALVYGNIAFPLGKKAEEGRTHRWICYVRGVQNEDLSYMIKKVIFSLHPSFPNPKRVVEKFPFEVQEEGWGEFEIAIKIYWIEPSEKPIELFHFLKLYPPEGQIVNPKKPVVSEFYEEIVFNQPRESFYETLMLHSSILPKPSKYSEYFTQFSEEKELDKITEAQQKITAEIQILNNKYEAMEAEIKQLEEELSGKQTSITLETTPSSFFENSESENSFMSLSNSGFE